MHITEKLRMNHDRPLFSIEIIPPKKGQHIDALFDVVTQFLDYTPAFISVTSHPHERVRQNIDGRNVWRVKRKRLDTDAICVELNARYGVTPGVIAMPHMVCASFTQDDTEDALYTLHFHRLDNVFAVRADPPKGAKHYRPRAHGHRHALQLVQQIQNMNNGIYLDDIANAVKTNFCIGVAGYPEGHIEARSLTADLDHLEEKIDAGASFIITQMFFDNEHYMRFADACAARGITVPIIPGIKPLYRKSHLQDIPAAPFNATIPPALRAALTRYDTPADVRKAGVDYAIVQVQQLIAYGVPCVQFFTMAKSDPIVDILEAVYKR